MKLNFCFLLTLLCNSISFAQSQLDFTDRFINVPLSEQVQASDLNGDGNSEILVWNQKTLKVFSVKSKEFKEEFGAVPGSTGLAGQPWVLSNSNLRSPTNGEFLLGFGYGRGELNANIRLYSIFLNKGALAFSKISELNSARAQPVSLIAGVFPGSPLARIFFTYFNEKYTVQTGYLEPQAQPNELVGNLKYVPDKVIRMATQWETADLDNDGVKEFVLGRPYGEALGADGDIKVLLKDKEEKITSLRGVQGVAVADTDGDASKEVFFGDGWHQDYGHEAKGRLSFAKKISGVWKSSLLELTTDQYSIGKIQAVDIDGDGRSEVIAAGNSYIKLYWLDKDSVHQESGKWKTGKIGDGANFVLATLSGDPYIIVPGSNLPGTALIPTKIYSLKSAKIRLEIKELNPVIF